MISTTRATLILCAIAGAAGCAETPATQVSALSTSARLDPAGSSLPLPAVAADASANIDEPTASAEPTASQGPAEGTTFSGALDQSYFNSEEFKRRFALSFLSVNDVEPKTTPDEAEELQEIIDLIKKDKIPRAMKKLTGAMNDTSSANYPYLIGQLHLGDERADLAMEAYLDAVKREPHFRRAWAQIGLLHYAQATNPDNESPEEDYKECARAYGKAASLGQVDEKSYGIMGIALLKSGKILGAETAFRQAIMMNPDQKDWVMGLAQCYFQSRRYDDAVVLLDGLIADDPNNAQYWLNQGNAYLGMKKPEMAGRNFRIVEQLGGGTAGSANTLADIYVNEGLSDVAVPVYLRALTLKEEASPDRGIRAAKLMTGRGDSASAKALLDGLETHFGEDLPDASINEMLKLRAKLAVREGRDGDQIEVLRQIVARDPLDGDGMILLAQALSRADELDEALFYFDTAASIEDFEAAAKLQHARVLVSKKRFAEAVPLLKASLQLEDKETVRTYLEGVEKAARRAID